MFTQSKNTSRSRSSTSRRSAVLFPLLACALLVGLAFGTVKTAQAQTGIGPTMPKLNVKDAPAPGTNYFGIASAPWRTHFGEHAAKVLREADLKAKRAAMRDLIALASVEGSIDLSETLTPLVQIVEQENSEELSLMALQAIEMIGTEHSSTPRYRQALRKLYRIAQEKSSDDVRVRRAAADVLVDVYGVEE